MAELQKLKPTEQLKFLSNGIFNENGLSTFDETLEENNIPQLLAGRPEIFQVNLGYMCNQTCTHCHVDAGPTRKEIMTKEVMDLCLDQIQELGIHTVDLTGGAPEMNPHFRYFVEALSASGVKEIIVRSNLTIILANPKYNDLPEFFRKHRVRVISSLPCYTESNTDKQRGKGVFNKSIEALKMLNAVGYGKDLILDLVYNPGGPFLPGNQMALESDYKEILAREHGVIFNSLFTITNLPINRFLEYLIASERYEEYMDTLVNAFNPSTVESLMCRDTLSVDHEGYVFDCDFNQMLDLPIQVKMKTHLSDVNLHNLIGRKISTGQHCYGCTAGAGSSCQGTLS